MTIGVATVPVAILVMLAVAFYDKREEKCGELAFFLQVIAIPILDQPCAEFHL